MPLFVYSVLNGVVIFFFATKKKRFHVLEIMIYWMVGSYVVQNFSALCYMNFKTLYVPEKLSYEFAHFINRIVLYPVLIVMFLEVYFVLPTLFKKLLLIVGSVFLFVGLEWLADVLGVLKHIHWRLWWSFAFWVTALFISIGSMKLFRKLLLKES